MSLRQVYKTQVKKHIADPYGTESDSLYYMNIFENYFDTNKYRVQWNFAAAIFGPFWLSFRGMYGYTFLLILIHLVIGFILTAYFSYHKFYDYVLLVFEFLLLGFYGNYFYIKFIEKKLEQNRIPSSPTGIHRLLFPVICWVIILFVFGFSKAFLSHFPVKNEEIKKHKTQF